MSATYLDIMQRIRADDYSGAVDSDSRSLLHAYIACLTFSDLCKAIAETLRDASTVRLALRSRLRRQLRDPLSKDDLESLVVLVDRTIDASDHEAALRPMVDSLHSHAFGSLPLSTQNTLLNSWIDRGTRGAMSRWLKATKEVPVLFNEEDALNYWRASRDARAAKSLAYQGSAGMLARIISELVDNCKEGWIVSRAAMRAEFIDEEVWQKIQVRHPATFLYLCAQSRRQIETSTALELAFRCSGTIMNGDRGLAIWSIGQMGMLTVLDSISDRVDSLQKRDAEEWQKMWG